jgi:hypothetical protein
MITIAIPYYDKMPNAEFLLNRCLQSIFSQTYTNYNIVITTVGNMAENTNNAIKASTGDLIKVLYMDDYFAHENALQGIVDAFTGYWLINGVDDNQYPYWTDNIIDGNNKLGSPSALTIKQGTPLFDEKLNWVLDCDFYRRMYDTYGPPVILDGVHVILGKHEGQTTNVLSDEKKQAEIDYLHEKYTTL